MLMYDVYTCLYIQGLQSELLRDRALSVTCQGQLSLEGTFLINDKRALRKIFEIFKKDLHHKKSNKILHLTFPSLRHRPGSKYFNIRSNTECPLKRQLSLGS